jgi:hypothetical protein
MSFDPEKDSVLEAAFEIGQHRDGIVESAIDRISQVVPPLEEVQTNPDAIHPVAKFPTNVVGMDLRNQANADKTHQGLERSAKDRLKEIFSA